MRIQVLPDFSIGYGTELEESMRWPDYLPWVALIGLVVFYIVRRQKRKAGKKR
jgi:hypothetical protein